MKAVIAEASPKRDGNSVTLAKQLIQGMMTNKDWLISQNIWPLTELNIFRKMN